MIENSNKVDKIISYVLHPILFPLIATLFYLLISPFYLETRQEYILISIVFVATYIIPILLLYLMRKLKLISSYQIEDINERRFPLFLSFLITLFVGRLIYQSGMTYFLSIFFFGSSITFFIAYMMVLMKIKLSLHTAGISSLLGFFIGISYIFSKNLLILIAVFSILTGLSASNRLKLEAHTQKEVYLGILVGFLTQIAVAAYYFYFL
ncbi:hypothetical protein [Aureivirga sp. CE67]|uniref:hypothetical protein n=1 Tax=Aureivirga sp. CE67 TaxID=1788983 RepID=UPI0018C9F9A0|nr:hypothetical protein [Aureivirga sp. CE67]